MKKRLSKFTLAASLAAALAFTFSSCSADGEEPGDNPGGGNLDSQLIQVYIAGNSSEELEKYGGNGDILLLLEKSDGAIMYTTGFTGIREGCGNDRCNPDTLLVGKIQNRRASLNLPDIDSKYVVRFEPCEQEKEHGHECKVSFPENLTGFSTRYLYATIPESDCTLYTLLMKQGKPHGRAYLDYFLESGKITGTNCTIGYCDIYNRFDWAFSKGWNIHYRYDADVDDTDAEHYNHTTDLSIDDELVFSTPLQKIEVQTKRNLIFYLLLRGVLC